MKRCECREGPHYYDGCHREAVLKARRLVFKLWKIRIHATVYVCDLCYFPGDEVQDA